MANDEQTTELNDVFDDSSSGSAKSTPEYVEPNDDKPEDKGETAVKTDEEEAGEDKTSGTPPEDQTEEEVVDVKGQKLIPEHRFKAALKSAAERAEKAERELAERDKVVVPVPDKETDPKGHERHVRMDASVQVMRELRPDYQEVIDHYATMAESNPLLNQAVEADPLPAKLAYDIAKKDMEIKDALKLKESPEYKEFLEFQKNKTKQPKIDDPKTDKRVTRSLGAVPNLNRSTNASPNRNVRTRSNGDNDDSLFEGAL